MESIPITIVTGFLGSGKTTLILNLIPQLPKSYKLALLKNEFGDVEIDSKLASASAISGVKELLNGCICCNLVGQLGDALKELTQTMRPDRVIIETSGSAFPATLAMEVNRLGRKEGKYVLDGVVVVIDVENWKGYEDTSYTAKMQARYTDLIVFNKWETVSERRYEDCLDRVGDLEVEVAKVKSDRGRVDRDVLLGFDVSLARDYATFAAGESESAGAHDHHSEVEVLSLKLTPISHEPSAALQSVDIGRLEKFLETANKEEVYRIKAIVLTDRVSPHLPGTDTDKQDAAPSLNLCALNWAFGRWTFTKIPEPDPSEKVEGRLLQMTVITARSEADQWAKRIKEGAFLAPKDPSYRCILDIRRLL